MLTAWPDFSHFDTYRQLWLVTQISKINQFQLTLLPLFANTSTFINYSRKFKISALLLRSKTIRYSSLKLNFIFMLVYVMRIPFTSVSNATECITCIITDFQFNLLFPAFAYLLSIENQKEWKLSIVYQKEITLVFCCLSHFCVKIKVIFLLFYPIVDVH